MGISHTFSQPVSQPADDDDDEEQPRAVCRRLHSYKLVRAFFVGCFSRGRKYRASSPWLDAVGPAATAPVVPVWAAVMTKFILSDPHPFGVEEPHKSQSNSFTLDVPRFGKTG